MSLTLSLPSAVVHAPSVDSSRLVLGSVSESLGRVLVFGIVVAELVAAPLVVPTPLGGELVLEANPGVVPLESLLTLLGDETVGPFVGVASLGLPLLLPHPDADKSTSAALIAKSEMERVEIAVRANERMDTMFGAMPPR